MSPTPVPVCPADSPYSPLCSLKEANFSDILGNSISLILVVAVFAALFFILIGGIKWILSGGDKTKIEAAQKQITHAVIGLVLTFLAFFLLNIIGHIFNVDVTTLQIPHITNN